MKSISRRQFLRSAARTGAVLGAGGVLLSCPEVSRLLGLDLLDPAAEPLDDLVRRAPVARYWTSPRAAKPECAGCHTAAELAKGAEHVHKTRAVRCLLCAHACLIAEGDRGRCRARMNVQGELRSLVYGRPIAEHVDPIEKKPFFHVLPGAMAYSLATSGCPLRCKFCQNWTISQASPEDYTASYCPPEAMARRAKERTVPVVAFTYDEPTVFTEYLTDIARAARKLGMKSVIISCGFMNKAPLAEMIEVLDAIKIDLKGFSPEFYREVSSAELAPVLRSIKQVAKAGRHLEIVNLVVPTLNDSDAMMTELSKWVAGEVGPDVPVHFTRFHPDYQLMNLPPTPVATLERAREIAKAQGLHYAYIGNVPGHPGENTYCPKCNLTLIERSGMFTTANRLKGGACPQCATKIPGVWT
jgi:pyruvate formate lyase activating enzyme